MENRMKKMAAVFAKYTFGGRAALVGLALIVMTGCALRWRHYNSDSGRAVTGYYSLAVNLDKAGVLAYPGSSAVPSAYRAPLYPVFLSLFAGETGTAMRAAFLAQLFIFILTVPLVWAAAALAGGPGFPALAAAGLYALHPAAVAGAASFEVEFFYGFLLAALAAALALGAVKKSGWKDWAPAFVLAGISITCKSPMALFPALLAAWLYFSGTGGARLRRRLPALLLLSYLALVPWAARNAAHFKTFIPFERNAALCNIYSAGAGMPGTCLPSEAARLYAEEGRGDLYSPASGALPLLKGIVLRPGNYVKGFLARLPLVFGTFPFLFLCSAAGLWLLRGNEAVSLLGLLAAYFTGVHLLFSFEARYLAPALPLLCALAAVPVGRLAAVFREPRPPFDAQPAARLALGAAACVILAVYALSAYLLAAETFKKGLKPQAADAVETLVPVYSGGGPAELASYYNQKGVLEIFSGDYVSGARDFRAAIVANPYYPDPYLSLAFALRAGGDEEAALGVCRAAAEKYLPKTAAFYSDAMLAELLKCQEISFGVLGRKKEAAALAARRAGLERKARAKPAR